MVRCFISAGATRTDVLWRAVALLLLCTAARDCEANQAGDQIEGAVWKFQMKAVDRKGGTRGGQFRVNNGVLYQKESLDNVEWNKVIGRIEPLKKGKSRLIFEDLQANKDKSAAIKGTAILDIDKFGHWTGRMIDSEGAHWHFQCARIQE
ncbi:MAG: hypothetical protein KF861_08300 [Planctomycetaceae bacterium]|nr:hypothetical protein [Planctomycetaceae bacterium]